MKNKVLALAHDMGEPWQGGCKNGSEPVECLTPNESYSFADTPQYEGLVYPRIKLSISQRLAYAGYDMLYPINRLSLVPIQLSKIVNVFANQLNLH